MNKKFRKTMRKAADGGNLALIALAIGVIIIIGMYIFTRTFGKNLSDKGNQISTAMTSSTVSAPTATNP